MKAKFFEGNFIKNVSILLSGTVLAQLLTIAMAPLLSRLYTPSEFGYFAIYTSIIAALATIVTFRYELAIVIPKRDVDAVNLVILCLVLTTVVSLITFVLIVLFGEFFSEILKISQKLMWWIPPSLLMVGYYTSFRYWSIRNKEFKRLSYSSVYRSLGVNGVQLPAGIAKFGAQGLIGGQFIGFTIVSLILGVQIWKDDKKRFMEHKSIKKMRSLVSEYNNFPKYSAPQGFINSFSQSMPTFFLAFYFGPQVAGLYAISLKFIQIPINLIGESFRQVFFQKASEMEQKGVALFNTLFKYTALLIVISVIPVLVVIFWGPSLYSFALGSSWYKAGEYAQWLIITIFFSLVTSPSVVIINILHLQRFYLVFEIIVMICRVVGIILGGMFLSALQTIAIYSLISTVLNIILLLLILFIVKKRERV